MTTRERVTAFITDPGTLLRLYVLLAVAASLIAYAWGGQAAGRTHYNNFLIFKTSFPDLLAGRPLYAPHPGPHYDLYKYTPTFALFFGLFAWLPDWLGLIAWNLLNALVLFSALRSVKGLNERQKVFALLFLVIELFTSMQSSQSNGLMAGLMIWAYNFLEDGRIARATLAIALAAFVKPFGLVAAALFLLYPRRMRFLLQLAAWTALLALIPIVATPPRTLLTQYEDWLALLRTDHSTTGLSVAGWLEAWFRLRPGGAWVTLAGIVLFCSAYLNHRAWRRPGFRLLLLASALIWAVIFNHKAESPTFIIAVSGVALWYVSRGRSAINLALLLLVFVFTCLSPTDVFPPGIRTGFVLPFRMKVLPCMLVWVKILFDQVTDGQRGNGSIATPASV
jgi:hypothetical protein